MVRENDLDEREIFDPLVDPKAWVRSPHAKAFEQLLALLVYGWSLCGAQCGFFVVTVVILLLRLGGFDACHVYYSIAASVVVPTAAQISSAFIVQVAFLSNFRCSRVNDLFLPLHTTPFVVGPFWCSR